MASEQLITSLKEMEVKAIDKRKSGEAFEVILKLPSATGDANPSPLKPQPKKEPSMNEIQTKLQAAEERRKKKQEAVVSSAKAEEEKILKVKQKKAEFNDSFSTWAEEQLASKMCQYKENHMALLESKIQKYRERNMKPEEMREKVKREIDEMCSQLDENLQQKLQKSEQLRKQQLNQVVEKQQEKENHAQQVRQKKLEEQAGDGAPAVGCA